MSKRRRRRRRVKSNFSSFTEAVNRRNSSCDWCGGWEGVGGTLVYFRYIRIKGKKRYVIRATNFAFVLPQWKSRTNRTTEKWNSSYASHVEITGKYRRKKRRMKFYRAEISRFQNSRNFCVRGWRRGKNGEQRTQRKWSIIFLLDRPFLVSAFWKGGNAEANFVPAGRAPRKSRLTSVIRHPRDVSLIARKVSLIVSYPLN